MLDQISREIEDDGYYSQNYANDGQRFVAWYLRRVLLLSPIEARQFITDGANDKQIDAVYVDDDNQRILIVQGKFIQAKQVDSEPLREVLGAWMRLRDLASLEQDANDRLKERLEAVRQALDDGYEIDFELLTTGVLTPAAQADLTNFNDELAASDFPASLELVDSDVIRTRLIDAEGKELPVLNHTLSLDAGRAMLTEVQGTRSVIAAVSLQECVKFPGVNDGRLFRKNVRQFLGPSNKVNRGLRQTINSDRIRDFFFYHNGITALCSKFDLSDDRRTLKLSDLSVVNGCQSLATIHSASQRVRTVPENEAYVLFRFYEIPQRDLADRISVFTNSQSAVKPRDLRSNDRVMLGLKRAFEARYPDGFFITQRGSERPADKNAERTVDCAELAKALMAWQCQRPNAAHNERRLFDEHYKTLFQPDYDPASILALKTWLSGIDKSWANLPLNDALKAGRSYIRLHLLYAVSALIAQASGQGDKVPVPAATLAMAQTAANEVLFTGANCLNGALDQALRDAQASGKVFSPQNWFKSRASVQSENLVVGTTIDTMRMLSGGQEAVEKLKIAPADFELRWSAE